MIGKTLRAEIHIFQEIILKSAITTAHNNSQMKDTIRKTTIVIFLFLIFMTVFLLLCGFFLFVLLGFAEGTVVLLDQP